MPLPLIAQCFAVDEARLCAGSKTSIAYSDRICNAFCPPQYRVKIVCPAAIYVLNIADHGVVFVDVARAVFGLRGQSFGEIIGVFCVRICAVVYRVSGKPV